MAITYEGAAPIGAATSTGTITIPAGVQAGDILVVEVSTRTSATITCTDDDTGGNTWTWKIDQAITIGNHGSILWKRATSGTASKTITVANGSNSLAAQVSVYRGCVATGDPFNAILAETNASGNETMAEITPSVDGCMIVLAVSHLFASTAPTLTPACTDPGALTFRSSMGQTSGNDSYVSHSSALQTTAAATGAFTWSQVNAASATFAYALAPAVATGFAHSFGVIVG